MTVSLVHREKWILSVRLSVCFCFCSMCRNILVGDNNKVKIADFGLSRTLAKENTYYTLSETKKLPVKWMALESIFYRKFSTYSDGMKH